MEDWPDYGSPITLGQVVSRHPIRCVWRIEVREPSTTVAASLAHEDLSAILGTDSRDPATVPADWCSGTANRFNPASALPRWSIGPMNWPSGGSNQASIRRHKIPDPSGTVWHHFC